MGKSKSGFDLNHDSISGDDLIWVYKRFDLETCDLICDLPITELQYMIQ